MNTRINISNYEAFWLDYLEGNLSEQATQELMNFLKENPSLEAELESVEPIVFHDESLKTSFQKSRLKKIIRPTKKLNESNWEEEVTHFFEGENSLNAQEINQFLAKNTSLNNEVELMKRARVKPNPSITYPNKNALKKKESTAVITFVQRAALAAAAAAALFFLLKTPTKQSEYIPRADSYAAVEPEFFESLRNTEMNKNENQDIKSVTKGQVPKRTPLSSGAELAESFSETPKSIDAMAFRSLGELPVMQSNSELAVLASSAGNKRNIIAPTKSAAARKTQEMQSLSLRDFLLEASAEQINKLDNQTLALRVPKPTEEHKVLRFKIGKLEVEHQF